MNITETDNLRFSEAITDFAMMIKEVGAERVWQALRHFDAEAGALYIAMLQQERKIPALCKPKNADTPN